jgi:small GTP-binding protein
MNDNKKYNIVLFGASTVGKSAITVQFIQDLFIEKYDPTIEDLYRKTIELDNEFLSIEIMDTAGSENFSSMRELYIRDGNGFLLVYSIISPSSLKELEYFHDLIVSVKETDKFPCLIVGNKRDLKESRLVPFEDAVKFAERFHYDLLEISAKSLNSVNDVFMNIIRKIQDAENVEPIRKKKRRCYIL